MNRPTCYITTPIYYPSDNLHIGHVYSTTLAWALKNYKKLQGYDVKLLVGADEHGQKIAKKAFDNNLEPQEYVDQMVVKFKKLWTDFEIDYDYFSRTTSDVHKEVVTKIFTQLLNQNAIYSGRYEGLYSISDEEFLTPTQAINKDGKFYHPVSNHLLITIQEAAYFLKLSSYSKWLQDYITTHLQFIIPTKVVNELVNNFLAKGLEDLSVTRSSFDWGIKVKEDQKHVIYVWLDALTNYITALGYQTPHCENFEKYWTNGTEIIHVIGKEISRFHGIYWPIILKFLNLRMPSTILAHGWLITQDGKMSKSKGNVINPYDLLQEFDPEIIKYYFASQIKVGEDGTFEKEFLKTVYNADLANNFGNLCSRTLNLAVQNFPEGLLEQSVPNSEITQKIINHVNQYCELFNQNHISEALKLPIQLSKFLNGYIEQTSPWNLKNNRQELNLILHNLCNGIYAIATMLKVVMPNKMQEVLKQLQLPNLSISEVQNFKKFNHVIFQKPRPLFVRMK